MSGAGFLLATVVCTTLLASCRAIPGPVDLGQNLADTAQYPSVKAPFRVDVIILRMLNPRATTWHFTPCDVIPGSCNNIISAVIDYETPNFDFGKDSVQFKLYKELFKGSGRNVEINNNMTKDVCGTHDTRKINVRVRALDSDVVSNDIIDQFSCFILTKNNSPAADEASAQWSDETQCVGTNKSHKIIWKYRWYRIPADQCTETPGSSGFIRQVIPFIGK